MPRGVEYDMRACSVARQRQMPPLVHTLGKLVRFLRSDRWYHTELGAALSFIDYPRV